MRRGILTVFAIPVGLVVVVELLHGAGSLAAHGGDIAGPALGALWSFTWKGLIVVCVPLFCFGFGHGLWQLSFPHRATVVMRRLVVRKDDRPRLRWVWRRSHTWTLAWRMPYGVTAAKLMQERGAIEEHLDCSVHVWYDRGWVWMRAGTRRLPETVSYDEFYSKGRPAGDLVFGVGMGRAGRVWADLAKLPHLLVGGMTGNGKSVFLRQLLVSLLEQHGPEALRLVAFDFKSGIEMRLFGELGHLLWPVAPDLEAGVDRMGKLTKEMDRRTSELERAGLGDIGEWNKRHPAEKWPYVVVVCDEIAEMSLREASHDDRQARVLLQAGFSRLCRLGRAPGIHCILCTQRPDADAVPGQIKNNIKATIAFFVRNLVNSEILLGPGNASASSLPPWPGRGVWQSAGSQGDTHVQVPLLERSEAETRLRALEVTKP